MPLLAHGQQALSLSEKTNILSSARQKYYNLRDAGLIELQANIQPNWEVVFAGAEVSSDDRTLLSALRFSCSIDPEGRLRFEHRSDVTPRNQAAADRIERVFRLMEDSLRGFFRNWSVFAFTAPFPNPGTGYAVKKRGTGYQFSQQLAELLVETDADNDFMITEIRVSRLDLTASLKPALERTPAGFLLKGYTASSQRWSGARATVIKALVEYETVSGLQLLHRVSLDTSFEGVPAKVEWLFTDYQVKVRNAAQSK